ncbi:MAG: TRAP transporter small permease [Tissierellaceae bacterium]
MKKLIKTLDKTEEVFLVLMFIAMVGIIFFQVIMRFVFNNSLSWSEEFGKFLFVWISWIGISIGHRRKEHIKITLLVEKLPYKIKKILEALSEIVLIVISGITLYYGVIMIGIQKKVPYAGIKISTSWGYLSLVLGTGLFIIRSVNILIEIIKEINRKDIII